MQSIEDVISRISFLDGKIDRLSNEIGETRGMVRNLRKVLIKLEVVDDRFVF
jgi:prefoldin subunit 5